MAFDLKHGWWWPRLPNRAGGTGEGVAVKPRVRWSRHRQGVFFRDSCQKRATEAGVSGSARNLSDGRVEVVLEGDESAVQSVIEWCREGPPHARVTSVDVSEEEPLGESGFSISG